MRSFIISLFLLLASVLGQAQHRTYLNTAPSSVHQDLYMTQDDDGSYRFYVQLENWEHSRDSVFIVLNESECLKVREAFRELDETYSRWSSAAHMHRIKSYSRPMDIEFPRVVFQWKATRDVYRKELYEDEFRKSVLTTFPRPVFIVDSEGRCGVEMKTVFYEADNLSNKYQFRTLFWSSSSIRNVIRRCNPEKNIATYKKMNPRRTAEFYDSIFR